MQGNTQPIITTNETYQSSTGIDKNSQSAQYTDFAKLLGVCADPNKANQIKKQEEQKQAASTQRKGKKTGKQKPQSIPLQNVPTYTTQGLTSINSQLAYNNANQGTIGGTTSFSNNIFSSSQSNNQSHSTNIFTQKKQTSNPFLSTSYNISSLGNFSSNNTQNNSSNPVLNNQPISPISTTKAGGVPGLSVPNVVNTTNTFSQPKFKPIPHAQGKYSTKNYVKCVSYKPIHRDVPEIKNQIRLRYYYTGSQDPPSNANQQNTSKYESIFSKSNAFAPTFSSSSTSNNIFPQPTNNSPFSQGNNSSSFNQIKNNPFPGNNFFSQPSSSTSSPLTNQTFISQSNQNNSNNLNNIFGSSKTSNNNQFTSNYQNSSNNIFGPSQNLAQNNNLNSSNNIFNTPNQNLSFQSTKNSTNSFFQNTSQPNSFQNIFNQNKNASNHQSGFSNIFNTNTGNNFLFRQQNLGQFYPNQQPMQHNNFNSPFPQQNYPNPNISQQQPFTNPYQVYQNYQPQIQRSDIYQFMVFNPNLIYSFIPNINMNQRYSLFPLNTQMDYATQRIINSIIAQNILKRFIYKLPTLKPYEEYLTTMIIPQIDTSTPASPISLWQQLGKMKQKAKMLQNQLYHMKKQKLFSHKLQSFPKQKITPFNELYDQVITQNNQIKTLIPTLSQQQRVLATDLDDLLVNGQMVKVPYNANSKNYLNIRQRIEQYELIKKAQQLQNPPEKHTIFNFVEDETEDYYIEQSQSSSSTPITKINTWPTQEDFPIFGDYDVYPIYSEIKKMTKNNLKSIENVQISNRHGSIHFLEPVSLLGKNIQQCVRITSSNILIDDPDFRQKKCEIQLFDFDGFSKKRSGNKIYEALQKIYEFSEKTKPIDVAFDERQGRLNMTLNSTKLTIDEDYNN